MFLEKMLNVSLSVKDPQDFGFMDLDPQKYADPRKRILGLKYQPKNAKKNISSKNY